jgi:hypothetical protein
LKPIITLRNNQFLNILIHRVTDFYLIRCRCLYHKIHLTYRRNDVFYFDSAVICEVISIQVFNRWGDLVYQSYDPYAPWGGGDYPSGTYYYVVRFIAGEDKGFITLIR